MSGGRRSEPRAATVEGRTSPHGRLTAAQIETLAEVYRETGNVTRAARSAGTTRETARRYLHRGQYASTTGEVPAPAPTPKKRADLGPAMAHAGRMRLRLPSSLASAPNVPAGPPPPAEEVPANVAPKIALRPAEPTPQEAPAPPRPPAMTLDSAHTLDSARVEALRLLRSVRGGTFVLWLQRVNELLTHPRGADGLPVPGWKPALAALRLVRMADLRDVIELEQMLLGVGTDAPDVEGVRRAKESEELLVQALIAQRAAAAVKAQANAARRADPDDDDGDDDDARPN